MHRKMSISFSILVPMTGKLHYRADGRLLLSLICPAKSSSAKKRNYGKDRKHPL